ncbi:MAG TPA: aromatic ring-hydroxylating dioxygenase subunit alpha [Acidimicrobiia bacterium]|nr:aromatic ring-hydroxylating dioxygenase subunit alpha [Acidimicrobiia bacterium]
MSADAVTRMLELFWHPVCTRAELAASAPHPRAVELLGRRLAIADLGGQVVAMTDRCPHRSTRLSVGRVEGDSVRCAYHGWRYAADGTCIEIPSTPDGPLPVGPCVESFEAQLAYDLVWVRLDAGAATTIPAHPAWDTPTMHVVAGVPYTWPTSALRRVENFVDLAHFPWVHDGTLGRRDQPVPPIPRIARVDGELRFHYDPPDMPVRPEALFGFSAYRMPMPCTVDIEFELESCARRHLWMTASPLDSGRCRAFWFVSRDDDLGTDDAAHLAFQQVVLDQDEPVVCNQDPPELVLDPGFELSVRTDRVSIEYRRWLNELVDAAARGAGAVATMLHDTASVT